MSRIFSNNCLLTVGQDIRERFSGAIEAFARKNGSSGRHGEPSRHRTLEDVPLSRDVVRITFSFSFPHSRKFDLSKTLTCEDCLGPTNFNPIFHSQRKIIPF